MVKSITVAKKYPGHNREVRFYVADNACPETCSLSELDMDTLTDVIENLTALTGGGNPHDHYAWGTDSFSVVSRAHTSSCRNDNEDTTLPDMATDSLLHLMTEIKRFKQQYQTVAMLQNIPGQAFTLIKTDPSRYKFSPGAVWYDTEISGIIISLNVNSNDLNLTANAFLDQLNTNF